MQASFIPSLSIWYAKLELSFQGKKLTLEYQSAEVQHPRQSAVIESRFFVAENTGNKEGLNSAHKNSLRSSDPGLDKNKANCCVSLTTTA